MISPEEKELISSAIIPITLVRFDFKPCAIRLGIYPRRSMVSKTRASVSFFVVPFLLITLETVEIDTPASFATSEIFIILFSPF